MSFQVGDRVRAVGGHALCDNNVGKWGAVSYITLHVTFDDGVSDRGAWHDFELVSDAEVPAEGLLEFLKGVAKSAETSANPDDPRVALADEILREFFNVSTSYRNTCVVEFSQRERQ